MSFWKVYSSYWFNKYNSIENQIELFKIQLYNEWYATLSKEEKEEHEKIIRQQKIDKETSYRKALVALGFMTEQCNKIMFNSEY